MFASRPLSRLLGRNRFVSRRRVGNHAGIVIHQRRFLEPLGIKRGTLEVAEVCDLVNRCGLFALPAPVTELDGAQLAETTKEAVPEQAVHEIIAFFRAKFDTVLTPEERERGMRAIALRAKKEKKGHVYGHVLSVRVSDEVMKAFVAGTDIDPLDMATTCFQAFPGSFDAEGSPNAAVGKTIRDIDGSLLPDLEVLAVTPEDQHLYELGVGNDVIISSATRVLEGHPLYAWINSTTYRHTFDGRVVFFLVPDFATHSIMLIALGYGAHPMEAVPVVGRFPDWLNVNLGAVVFDTMLASLVEAVELHVRTKKVTKLTAADLAAIRTGLELPLPSLSERLILRHLVLELFGLLSIPTLQASRMVAGGNTTAAPHKQ